MDFISEMCGGISKLNVAARAHCYQYMGPWTKNLACFTDPTNQHYEPSGTKFRDCIRMLIDMTTAENEVSPQTIVYSNICR